MRWFGYLLETHPLAFWGGVWVSVFLVAVVAVGSLLSPSASERRSVSAIALGSDSGVATQPLEQRGKVPFWMFGAIALTCTAGSILVSRQLQPDAPQSASSRPRDAVPRRVTSKSQTVSFRSKQPHRAGRTTDGRQPARQPKRLQPYSPTETLFQGTTQAQLVSRQFAEQSVSSSATQQVSVLSFVVDPRKRGTFTDRPSAPHPVVSRSSDRQPSRSSSSVSKVPVTVVPADQVHPLDWNQPRLADKLDLRKRKSIQSLL